MKTILITGGCGFLGVHLARHFIKNKYNVILLDTAVLTAEDLKNKVTTIIADIRDIKKLESSLKNVDYVVHAAAALPIHHDRKYIFDVNVNGTRNILQASLDANVQKLVFTSSAAVLGPSLLVPLTEKDSRTEPFESEYDRSKYFAENLVREFVNKGLNAVIVNPSRVYGPGPATYSNAVNRMMQYVLNKKIVLLPKIDNYISNYCYISDVVDGHILAMQKGGVGENYILGGENISYGKLLHSVREYAPGKNHILKIPVPLLKGIAFISRLISKKTELTPSLITRFAKHRMLNSEKAIKELGYHITPFEKGLKTTIGFLNNNGYKTKQLSTKFYQYGKDQVSTRTT